MSANEQVMEMEAGLDLYDEFGERQYYTIDEFMDHLRVAINDHYGYEVIKRDM